MSESTLQTETYEWELGISFLSLHEAKAKKIQEELTAKGISTYIYTEHTEKQYNGNITELYADIFLKKIRIPIILFSKGWGVRGTTLVEKDAIQKRYKEIGNDAFFLIKIDEDVPSWLASKIYEEYDDTKIDSLTDIIIYKLREVRGLQKEKTPKEKYLEQQQKVLKRQTRDSFLYSRTDKTALNGAIKEFNILGKLFLDETEKENCPFINNVSKSPAKLDYHLNSGFYAFKDRNFCISILWHSKVPYDLEGNRLYIYAGELFYDREIHEVSKTHYMYTIDEYGNPGWALITDPDSYYTSKQIFDFLYNDFVTKKIEYEEKEYKNSNTPKGYYGIHSGRKPETKNKI